MISAARLAWLQLRREKVRFAVALAGVAFAVILMFMQLGFQDALFRSAVNLHGRLLADLVLVHHEYRILPRPTRFARRRLYQALGFDGVASISPLHTSLARWKNPADGDLRKIFVLGVDPARPALSLGDLAQGLDEIRYPDRILFDRRSRPEFGPVPAMFASAGEVVTEANRHQLAVRGLFELGTSFGVDGTILVSDVTFHRLFPTYPPGGVTIGLVRLEPGADPLAVRDAMRARLERDVLVLTRQEFMDREVRFWARSTPIGFVFAFGVVMGLVVGVVIVYQILSADIADHLSEYATLKAMGYTTRYLAGVVLMEATILAGVGFVPGVLAAWRLYGLARDATMLPMALAAPRGALVLGLTLMMCWVSGLIAMRKLRSAQPAEMF